MVIGFGREHFDYGGQLASVGIVLVISLTFSCIVPAIMPVCALFFGCASLVYRWLFDSVYEPEFDDMGSFAQDLFHKVMLAVFLGTLSLLSHVGYTQNFSGSQFKAL